KNESNLATPLPVPIPQSGLSVTLEVTTKVLSGNSKPSDFTITVSRNRPTPRTFSGSSSGTTVVLKLGKYSVSGTTVARTFSGSSSGTTVVLKPGEYVSWYSTTYSPECSGTASGGIPIKCTVTNQYAPC